MVATMRGEVSAEQLGTTLMHEHVFVVNPDVAANFTTVWDEEAAVADATRRLNELHGAGVDTIVDLTVVGLGRCIPRIQRVAGALLVVLGALLATGAYRHLTSYLGRFTPAVRGL